MKAYKRIFLIVLDSLGIGGASDASEYNDEGSNTLKHISENSDLKLMNLEGLGLGNLGNFKNIYKLPSHLATIASLEEASVGKDTMTGHWEMMGLKIIKPFITFTESGFPAELITAIEEKTNRKVVGNYASSGTEILDDLGEHQIKTGDLIVYTSADSVLQIAAHEEHVGLDVLYEACKIARELTMKDEWKIGRVIARPYIGEKKGQFKRTSNRHDYALAPFGKTVLDSLKEKGLDVISVGKINDIFNGVGITESYTTKSNSDGMEKSIDLAKNKDFTGLAFINLVDFDSLYGHRRDPQGYGEALNIFDEELGELLWHLNEDDLLMITADHGNDPTFPGSDHTREDVPLIMYSKSLNNTKNLGKHQSFGVIGATIADNFEVENLGIGETILEELLKK